MLYKTITYTVIVNYFLTLNPQKHFFIRIKSIPQQSVVVRETSNHKVKACRCKSVNTIIVNAARLSSY